MSDEERPIATGSQTVGPFFHFGLTPQPNGRMIDRFTDPGEPIRLRVTVTDGAAEPVGDAMLELWQEGVFGRMPTSADGSCEFETVLPRTPAEANQAPHVNVCLFARGLLRQLQTRIYFPDDPALGSDPVLARVPAERRQTLMARPEPGTTRMWQFDIRLQGPHETVFFDA